MTSYRFNDFELAPPTRRLRHRGEDVAIGVRVFETIVYLVQNRHRAVGRDELLSAVWGRVDAGDATLAQAVLKARRAFGDDGNSQNFIRTVARFGYQWVAPTTEIASEQLPAPVPTSNELRDAQPAAGSFGANPSGAIRVDASPVDASRVDVSRVDVSPVGATAVQETRATPHPDRSRESAQRFTRRSVPLAAFTLALASVAALGAWLAVERWHAPASAEHENLRVPSAATVATIPGLILVTPTHVNSMAADDGWMRLGVMSLNAQALAGVAGHAVVPDEMTLAAVAHVGENAGVEALRAATGAAIVIASEANRVGEDWRIDATVFNADGSAQIVSARASDPVAAASSLARNLRELLAPEGSGDAADTIAPDVLALAAHMKAAILEAQNGRALALLAKASKATAQAPQVVLLEAEALDQLGKPQDAIDALRPLVDTASVVSPPPHWLPDAWSALGDSELARGHPAQAEEYFRRAIQLDGIADRRSLGLALRGLGISQVVRNDLDGAEQSYLRARLELEPVGDRLLLARVTDGLGYIATTRGRMADALLLYEQAADMGAAAGLNETELGSRLNIAQAHHYLLHHTLALTKLRELLPRIQAVDYPALHRFGSVAYANALIEIGALSEARAELARLNDVSSKDAATDAVVDVRLDEAGINLALGDASAAIRLSDAVRREHDAASAPDLRLEASAVLLNAYLDAGDKKAAAALAADANAWEPANAGAPARVHAHVAKARWAADAGDAASALDHYRQALALAREFGTPLVLRDAAVPYAQFQLDAGAIDVARTTASIVGPYAEDDFAIALLMGRVAARAHDEDLARSYFAQAHRLAGERWTKSMADEEAGISRSGAPIGPEPRTIAGG